MSLLRYSEIARNVSGDTSPRVRAAKDFTRAARQAIAPFLPSRHAARDPISRTSLPRGAGASDSIDDGTVAATADLQVYPSTGAVSFKGGLVSDASERVRQRFKEGANGALPNLPAVSPREGVET